MLEGAARFRSFPFFAKSGTRGALTPLAVDAVGCGSNSLLLATSSGSSLALDKAWYFGFLALLNFGLGLGQLPCRPIEARSSILPIAQHTRVVCRAMGPFLFARDGRRLEGRWRRRSGGFARKRGADRSPAIQRAGGPKTQSAFASA